MHIQLRGVRLERCILDRDKVQKMIIDAGRVARTADFNNVRQVVIAYVADSKKKFAVGLCKKVACL